MIEAKLHLTNASIDLFTGHETDKAKDELKIARRFLDQAAEHAKKQQIEDRYQKQITELQKAFKDMSTNPTNVKQSTYEALQHELRNMIRSL